MNKQRWQVGGQTPASPSALNCDPQRLTEVTSGGPCGYGKADVLSGVSVL